MYMNSGGRNRRGAGSALIAMLVAVLLTAVACGDGDGDTAAPSAAPSAAPAPEASAYCEEAGDVSTRTLRRGETLVPGALSDVTWDDSEGDLRVFNTIVKVVRHTRAGHLLVPGGVLCPEEGYALLALDLEARITPWDDPQATLAVTIGGSSIDAPLGDGEERASYLLVTPVPADGDDVDLVLRRDGFEARHSLIDDTHIGPKPEILYRDANQPFLETSPNSGSNLAFTAQRADYDPEVGTGQFRVTSAALSYFSPTRTDTASDPDRAYIWIVTEYLDVEGEATWNVHHPLELLPADRATLTLSDGTEVPLQRGEGMNSSDAYFDSVLGGDDAFFTFVWWAQVPADLTSATFRVTPGTVRYPGASGSVTFDGTAEIGIDF